VETNRRAFLAGLSALPFVGRLIPKPAIEVKSVPADGCYREYMATQMKAIASSMGVPYGVMSVEMRQAEYSAYLASIENARHVKAMMALFIGGNSR
jgi:hypothetical protein